jgi:hypothetical protein
MKNHSEVNKSQYIGEIKNDIPNGYGIEKGEGCIYKGEVYAYTYIGGFLGGVKHGVGILILNNKNNHQENGEIITIELMGYFQNGSNSGGINDDFLGPGICIETINIKGSLFDWNIFFVDGGEKQFKLM